ncbi:MAG: phosphoglycerate mutase family protein, partial [Chloroflexota bacterium]|nr:phosphoglycerate mutase family protein [Chloroflexota bacterium]
MRLYLIRHGRTWPTGPDSQEWPLSPEGVVEAEALAGAAFWTSVQALNSSPEPKAVSTVQPAARRYQLEIRQDERLIEVRRPSEWLGDYEGAI